MASTITLVVFASFVLQKNSIISGSTHWIVTEDGRIQAQSDSVYNLRRPYDLVAFMDQEHRASMLTGLKKELLNRKDEIDKNEDRDTGLEQKFYKTNPDCIDAGKPLPEFDLYISTVLPLENKGIRPEEHIDMNGSLPPTPRAPDCTAFMDLDFSMHAFEHLEGMKDRTNLNGSAELGLKNAITHRENVDEYGHLVYEALTKNNTSWVLYNMAAFYWRIKGNRHQAVECIRRALHHAPSRFQKDVALISLANILHRAQKSNEAAILVHAALEVSKELNVNHFTLGNIYAVLGEYNKSIICFENTLKIQPDFEAAAKRRHAVLCHSKLEAALEAQHRSLQRTLKDLKDYQKKHDTYQSQSDKLLSEQVPHEVKVAQHYAYEQIKARQKTQDSDEYCRMVERGGKQVLLCTWSRRSPTLDFDFAFLEENAEERKENKVDQGNVSANDPKKPDYSQPMKPPLYSKAKKHTPGESDVYTAPNWPLKEECDSMVLKVPDPRNLTTIYLSPENKGFEVKELLSIGQGLGPGDEHPLPWYPPVCVPLLHLPEGNPDVYDHLKAVSYAERSRIPLKYNDPSMRKVLLSHVNEGSVTGEEVGQRILTALKKNIGPQWVLYNLAGLYWRIIGNNYHGIECLRRSIHLSPKVYRDIPLVNLANILYRYGRYDDAIVIMKDALQVNDVEPLSHFLLGHLLWATRNYSGASHHYQEALAYLPSHGGALEALRAMKCYLKYHQAAQSAAPLPVEKSVATTSPGNCGGTKDPLERESRVICKSENNEEKCIIETRSRNRAPDCHGQCTQTCTITPVKMEGCNPGGDLEGAESEAANPIFHALKEMSASKCGSPPPKTVCGPPPPVEKCGLPPPMAKCGPPLSKAKCAPVAQSPSVGHCAGKGGKQFTSDQDDMLFSTDFTSKLDEVSEYYEKKGVCEGEECGHMRVQQGNQKPHTKLEFIDGALKHKLIFLQVSPAEMQVEEEDCIIFNDGTKSPGCQREEFRTYIDDLERDIQLLEKMLKQHGASNVQCTLSAPGEGEEVIKLEKSEGNYQVKYVQEEQEDQEDQEEQQAWRKQEEEKRKKQEEEWRRSYTLPVPPPARPSGTIGGEREEEEEKLPQVEEGELPDSSIHLGQLGRISWEDEGCDDLVKVDLMLHRSTWLEGTISVREYIDYSTVIKHDQEEPYCPTGQVAPLQAMGHLPGVAMGGRLEGGPEAGLVKILQLLGGEEEPTSVTGTRIAHAIHKNSTSWFAYNLAALFWRVEGDAGQALACIQMALTYVPHVYKDLVFINLANILHNSGYSNDALLVTHAALDVHADKGETHFTMANIYASKSAWHQAVLFYQSTLGLSPHFTLARDRLKVILCQGLAAQQGSSGP